MRLFHSKLRCSVGRNHIVSFKPTRGVEIFYLNLRISSIFSDVCQRVTLVFSAREVHETSRNNEEVDYINVYHGRTRQLSIFFL